MIIRRIRIENFRNIERADLRLSRHYNLVRGRNSQGKTNLVEAMHFFSIGRSFRTRSSDEVVKFGEEYMYMGMEGERDEGVKLLLEVSRERGGRVRAKIDGERLPLLSDIIGAVPTVIFVPEDIEIVSGAPALRRRYIDYAAAQVSGEFLAGLKGYRRALKQKNRVLKILDREGGDRGVLKSLNGIMADRGVVIARGRRKILDMIARRVKKLYREMAGEGELVMDYRSSFRSEDGEEFRDRLKEAEGEEIEKGYSVVGPHRDDIRIREEDVSMRKYGSRGRKRLTAMLMKIAQADVIAGERGERPVLLMDDVYSELDDRVAERMGELLRGRYQVVATTPRMEERWAGNDQAALFTVEDGEFSITV